MTVSSIPAPQAPTATLNLGLTGHREGNAAFAANRAQIVQALDAIFSDITNTLAALSNHRTPVRLYTLLADGADQVAAELALQRSWPLIAPLPFGLALNTAINAFAASESDVRALLHNDFANCSAPVRQRAERIQSFAKQAHLFELAERDTQISEGLLAVLQAPHDRLLNTTYEADISLRAALAGKVMIEQCDLLIGIWDGATRALIGGTGHTIQVALDTGTPVLWINANNPTAWRILRGPEALVGLLDQDSPAVDVRNAALHALLRQALLPAAGRHHPHHAKHNKQVGADSLAQEVFPLHSKPLWHLYRRVEAVFGATTFAARYKNLRQHYETPQAIATGSAATLLQHAQSLPQLEAGFVAKLNTNILQRFAWADGISSFLSDLYRGGMVANFLLAPLAIISGIAYLPFASSDQKWVFALFELVLLLVILGITLRGQKHRWHGRWFETRRVAEYLRHAPIMLLLGVARAPARWLQGTETSWPEWYARHTLREVGLPKVALTPTYLRSAVTHLLHPHVRGQRDYHLYKAKRLANAHHNLDHLSEWMFKLAVISVGAYLALKIGGKLHLWPLAWAEASSYFFTFLGVLLPTFGGAIAGIRYFGDFERFSAISSITAEKLDAIDQRIVQLLAAPDEALDYSTVADIAHATDEVVVSEIENWQSVFGGKHVSVPV